MSGSTVDAWEGLRVGDRVRVFVSGARNIRPDVFEVVKLRLTDAVLSGRSGEAVAVVRGVDGEVLTMSARMLRPAENLS
jgi:hypothetical protein